MGRPKKIRKCPYNDNFCDGQEQGGDMMCSRCYDDIMEKEFGVEFATAEEADIKVKELGKASKT
jgi:hypothetical protein